MEAQTVLNITEFHEKPTKDYARSNLRVPGIEEGQYLTLFGQYIIQPSLFEFLEEHITHNVRERGEFQLTSALERVRQAESFLGLVIDGERFDIGVPDSYVKTVEAFRK
jgi:UTP--glucose-1-phosphate uridylyltransferase